mmetsp:Transcript_28330/g.70792  ORF Transcript_28330/g.70792 Transcript_28330/m.70792 type:complete len:158 (+) Transcript_28330:1164-1637(+)
MEDFYVNPCMCVHASILVFVRERVSEITQAGSCLTKASIHALSFSSVSFFPSIVIMHGMYPTIHRRTPSCLSFFDTHRHTQTYTYMYVCIHMAVFLSAGFSHTYDNHTPATRQQSRSDCEHLSCSLANWLRCKATRVVFDFCLHDGIKDGHHVAFAR